MINWHTTSALYALVGGLLIGLAVAIFILVNGRIAGISGILGGLLQPKRGNIGWRICFLAGLIISPWVYVLFQPLPPVNIQASTSVIIIAGLLVGIGTRFSAGCTSGHGVCGIALLSVRSIFATLTFMFTGIATVFLTRLFFV